MKLEVKGRRLGRPLAGQSAKDWVTSGYKKSKRCERCDKEGRLHTHHKDRDTHNNFLENLETLCPACHAKEHGAEISAAKLEHYKNPENREIARQAALAVVTEEARRRSSIA